MEGLRFFTSNLLSLSTKKHEKWGAGWDWYFGGELEMPTDLGRWEFLKEAFPLLSASFHD